MKVINRNSGKIKIYSHKIHNIEKTSLYIALNVLSLTVVLIMLTKQRKTLNWKTFKTY